MRALFLHVLAAVFVVVPLAADAANSKGPWSALVNADGSKVHGDRELLTGRRLLQPVGVYEVVVSLKGGARLVDDCVAVASPYGTFGTIGVSVGDKGQQFFVWTTLGAAGALADFPFYIVVHCPKPQKGG